MVRKSNISCGSISMVVLLIKGQREITLCIPCYKCKPWQLTPAVNEYFISVDDLYRCLIK